MNDYGRRIGDREGIKRGTGPPFLRRHFIFHPENLKGSKIYRTVPTVSSGAFMPCTGVGRRCRAAGIANKVTPQPALESRLNPLCFFVAWLLINNPDQIRSGQTRSRLVKPNSQMKLCRNILRRPCHSHVVAYIRSRILYPASPHPTLFLHGWRASSPHRSAGLSPLPRGLARNLRAALRRFGWRILKRREHRAPKRRRSIVSSGAFMPCTGVGRRYRAAGIANKVTSQTDLKSHLNPRCFFVTGLLINDPDQIRSGQTRSRLVKPNSQMKLFDNTLWWPSFATSWSRASGALPYHRSPMCLRIYFC